MDSIFSETKLKNSLIVVQEIEKVIFVIHFSKSLLPRYKQGCSPHLILKFHFGFTWLHQDVVRPGFYCENLTFLILADFSKKEVLWT